MGFETGYVASGAGSPSPHPPGWKTLVVLVALLGGVGCFIGGIVAHYRGLLLFGPLLLLGGMGVVGDYAGNGSAIPGFHSPRLGRRIATWLTLAFTMFLALGIAAPQQPSTAATAHGSLLHLSRSSPGQQKGHNAPAVVTATPRPSSSPPSNLPQGAPLSAEVAAQVKTILAQAVSHYRELLSQGQVLIQNFTPLPDAGAGLSALQDPSSVPSRFSQWRTSTKVESETSYLAAVDQAKALYPARSVVDAFPILLEDMADAQGHLGGWVNDVTAWFVSDPSGSAMSADSATVVHDLDKALRDVDTIVSQSLATPAPPTPIPTPRSNLSGIPVTLTGYGALTADWAAHHQADASRVAGTAFLPRNPDGSDRYAGVEYDKLGRVWMYSMFWGERGVSMVTAKAAIFSDNPTDARIIYDQRKDTCEQFEIASDTLGRVADGDGISGGVLFELSTTINGSNNSFDPARITDAIIQPATPGDQSHDC